MARGIALEGAFGVGLEAGNTRYCNCIIGRVFIGRDRKIGRACVLGAPLGLSAFDVCFTDIPDEMIADAARRAWGTWLS